METLEAFCAEHNVTFDEILYEWPASKFEAIYEAFAKRKIADDLNNRRSLEMASIMTAQFEKTEDLTNALDEIDLGYSKAIAKLYNFIPDEDQEEEEIDLDDPFYQAMQRGLDEKELFEPTIGTG